MIFNLHEKFLFPFPYLWESDLASPRRKSLYSVEDAYGSLKSAKPTELGQKNSACWQHLLAHVYTPRLEIATVKFQLFTLQ